MRVFEDWLQSMKMSINGYDYYVDFPKIYENVNKMKRELCLLNSLIGSPNIQEEFISLIKEYPSTLQCIPILLAVRQHEIYAQDEEGSYLYEFCNPNYSLEQYCVFMEKTGLFDLISHHVVNNLVDYALGIETGLDSNGRKNRGGHQMEHLVERYIKKTGVEYYREMYLTEIEEKWGLDLSSISAEGTSTKRWDFVVKTDNMVYVIETNFYASGGSKLNETSRSYKMIAEEAQNIPKVEFIWITDGGGWKKARRNLEETFNTMKHLYNIHDMEQGVLKKIFQ